ncbi:MAG: hypothetical protein KDE58_31340 [Caldilineaceae bacterium]|nr:hypothetical protein [Caldilineaceae bacterium]
MANLPSNLSKEVGEQLYQSLLEVVQRQIEQQVPNTFTFSRKPTQSNSQAASGLIVQKAGLDGYCHIFPVFNHMVTENWRLVILDTLQEYNALFYKALPEETTIDQWASLQHFHEDFLEGTASPDPAEIADKIIEWAFPPPRQPVLPFQLDVQRLALEIVAHGRRLRFTDADRIRAQWLQRMGRLQDAGNAVNLHVTVDLRQARSMVTTDSLHALEADLHCLLPDRLVWHFPSQRDGRWSLRQRVILATYESRESLGRFRKLALVAVSPARRRDPQRIQLQFEAVIPENHLHRWDSARWFWDERAQNTADAQRWGIEGLLLDILRQDRKLSITALQERSDSASLTRGERVALAILLQDEGRFDEALCLFDVTIGENLWKVIGNEKVYFRYYHYPRTQTWTTAVQNSMWQCAPWRLLPALQMAKDKIEPLHALNRGKHSRIPTFRLYALSGQRDARKVSLVVSAIGRDVTHSKIELTQTGSNRRLAAVHWQRPLEIDFLRYGVLEGILSD